jgi:DNA topoisomerase-1
MVVEREREIQGFVPREFWTITAELAKHQAPQGNGRPPQSFLAELVHHKGEKGKLDLPNEERARAVLADLDGAAYHVAKVSKKDGQRRPPPPFITSTLQQEAWRKLRFSARQTMLLAQQLYEGLSVGNEGSVGLITYMRTDSTHLATAAVAEARSYIERSFGKEHLPEHPRVYTRKVKGAQEAHEAIRPTSIHRTPESVRPYLAREQFRLYELVWQRMVACQMANATFEATTVEVDARSRRSRNVYLFRAVGTIQTFAGFLALYQEGRDETNGTGDDMAAQGPLPPLQVNDALDCLGLKPEQHFTKPPPRYTEATLVKALEDNGIGRPSTYASILSTLLDREYVKKDDGRLVPQEIGGLVNDLLVAHFPSIIDLQFTAKMEEELDQIARGERSWEQFLAEFYAPFSHDLQKAETAIPDEAANQTCDKCSKPMVIRVGRFGRFMACSGFPECKNTRPLPKEEAAEQPSDEVCDKCGKPMVVKSGRYGKFLSCTGFPVCKNSKPLLVKTGAQCPRCGGDLVERRAARAKGRGPRTFYGCVNYPTCDFTTPNRPLPTPCPECGGLLTTRNGRSTSCTKCSYRGEVAELSKEPTAVEA